jgi:sortase (surface protein transpeptidase)
VLPLQAISAGLAGLLIAAGVAFAGCGSAQESAIQPSTSTSGGASSSVGSSSPTAQPSTQSAVPARLIPSGLDIRSGPIDVPLVLRIPSLELSVPVLGVGITPANVMDAPAGPAADPVWQKAFWYRGSGIPGEVGTATLAGHVDDVLGRPAAFARLKDLRAGDTIVLHDTRSGLDVSFAVTETQNYTNAQAYEPAVLTRLYGAGPVAGKGPQPAADGLAHLVLITCAGTYVHGSFDHRLAVFAQRSG